MILFPLVFAYFTAVSLLAYRAFAYDKECAIAKTRRTPEATLLLWAGIGGWPGAKYAQRKLRHKSYEQPFGRRLNDIGVVYGLVMGTLAVFLLCCWCCPPSVKSLRHRALAQMCDPRLHL